MKDLQEVCSERVRDFFAYLREGEVWCLYSGVWLDKDPMNVGALLVEEILDLRSQYLRVYLPI